MALSRKPFTDVIGEMQSGRLLQDLTRSLAKITAAVGETHKAGELHLKIKITPTGKGSVQLNADVVEKVPEHDRPGTTFFVTSDNTLLRDDPTQERLPFRAVETPDQRPVREVGE